MKNLMKKGTIAMLTTVFMVFVLAGCNNEEPAANQEVLEETAFAENAFAQLEADVEDALPYESLSSGREESVSFGFGFGNCMTRTVEKPDDAGFPKVITIEYDGSCTSNFGVVKSGKIIITLTGQPSVAGSQRIVTFDQFMVNGNLIEGTKPLRTMATASIASCWLVENLPPLK
ncbi:MAG: hypothetical protein HC819_00535, partial [Cyclobacteriaceae bacterium]|nr:hypothetical protein [Cyclobacteriaceae bacterium]